MKKLAQRLLPVTLLLAALVTACTTDEGTPAPNFPDPVEDFVEPNSTYTLHLSPNQEWMVSIPSTASDFWGIRNGEQISYSIGGPAGDVTVEIVCLAEMNDLADHEVEVSMRMGGETRVIATLTLSRGEALLNIVPAKIAEDSDGHEYFQTPAESTGFLYEYGEPLAEGAAVPMLWDATRNGYVSYIRVESNFSYGTNIETAGLRLTELESPSASGRYSEYEIFCSQVNLGEPPVSYSFDITSEVEGFEEVAVSVNAPQFVPVLEVRATVPDDENRNFQTPSGDDSPYNWLYSETPLTLSESADGTGAGNVDLLWRPSATITEVDAYILVKANFNLTVAGAGWVSVGDGTVVEETSDNYETETYYRIYVAPSDIVTAGAKSSTVTINFGDETDNVYSRTFNVTSPDITGIFYVDRVPDFTFDAEGGYQADEMGMSTNATVEITSAARVRLKSFFANENGFYFDNDLDSRGWINLKSEDIQDGYLWSSDADVIQSNAFTVNVDINESDVREGIVMAFPETVWKEISGGNENADVSSTLFIDGRDGSSIRPEYAQYLVANVEQLAQAGLIEPYEPTWWEYAAASFEPLEESDPAYSELGVSNAYQITYMYNDFEGSMTIGIDTQFDINFDYSTYEILDENLEPLVNPWIKLAKGDEGRFYVEAALSSNTESKTAYLAFVGDSGYEAIIKVVYAPGGSDSDISLSMMYPVDGISLSELVGENMIPEGIPSCWLIECTKAPEEDIVISGLGAGVIWEETSTSSWVTINQISSMTYITITPENAGGATEGYIRCMDTSGKYICSLVFRLNITE